MDINRGDRSMTTVLSDGTNVNWTQCVFGRDSPGSDKKLLQHISRTSLRTALEKQRYLKRLQMHFAGIVKPAYVIHVVNWFIDAREPDTANSWSDCTSAGER